MDINKETLPLFRKDFSDAVRKLEEKYEVKISLGTITYSENTFSCKMEVRNGREEYESESAAFDDAVWKYAHLGLTEGMYNRVFVGKNNQLYALQGFNTRAKKYPLKILNIRTGEKIVAGEGFIKELRNEYFVASL